ncbi:hypothetical protein F5884DRAFT_862977 [Xylogone sp. PMI_703]|nr:hypothetical protein F5884DRAFT_862977 [Xylogone sp. PMI_703]
MFCGKCGNKANSEFSYCMNCGGALPGLQSEALSGSGDLQSVKCVRSSRKGKPASLKVDSSDDNLTDMELKLSIFQEWAVARKVSELSPISSKLASLAELSKLHFEVVQNREYVCGKDRSTRNLADRLHLKYGLDSRNYIDNKIRRVFEVKLNNLVQCLTFNRNEPINSVSEWAATQVCKFLAWVYRKNPSKLIENTKAITQFRFNQTGNRQPAGLILEVSNEKTAEPEKAKRKGKGRAITLEVASPAFDTSLPSISELLAGIKPDKSRNLSRKRKLSLNIKPLIKEEHEPFLDIKPESQIKVEQVEPESAQHIVI